MKTLLAIFVTCTLLSGCALGPVQLGSDSSYKYPNTSYSSSNYGYGTVYPNSTMTDGRTYQNFKDK